MSFHYDIALSFAGENRDIAKQIANKLTSFGVTVFFDEFERVELWGKNLYEHLSDIYSKKARYFIPLISSYYIKKRWTKLEWRSAQERAFNENAEYILPLRIDETPLPGLPETIGFISLQEYDIDEIIELILGKIYEEKKKQHKGIKIGISGSSKTEDLCQFCQNIGKSIIDSGNIVVSGGTKWVGYQVSLGAYQFLLDTNADYFGKRSKVITYTNENHPEFPAVKFGTPIPITQDEVEIYRHEFINSIDLMLFIRGNNGTFKEFRLCKLLGKPILPIGFTGGSAFTIAKEIIAESGNTSDIQLTKKLLDMNENTSIDLIKNYLLTRGANSDSKK